MKRRDFLTAPGAAGAAAAAMNLNGIAAGGELFVASSCANWSLADTTIYEMEQRDGVSAAVHFEASPRGSEVRSGWVAERERAQRGRMRLAIAEMRRDHGVG